MILAIPVFLRQNIVVYFVTDPLNFDNIYLKIIFQALFFKFLCLFHTNTLIKKIIVCLC